MKALIVFSFFLVSRKSNAVEFRCQSFQPGTDEIVGALHECIEIEKFNVELFEYHRDESFFTPEQKTSLTEVNSKIGMLDEVIMNGLSDYFDELLFSYFKEAYDFVSGQLNETTIDMKRDIGIGDHEFCVVLFLIGYGYYDSAVFYTISFLQTIRFKNIEAEDLKNMLMQLMNLYNSKSLDSDTLETNEVKKSTVTELLNIKKEIKHFSNTFCLSNVQPLVDKDLFEPLEHIDKEPFINYMFQEEECHVYITRYRYTIMKTLTIYFLFTISNSLYSDEMVVKIRPRIEEVIDGCSKIKGIDNITTNAENILFIHQTSIKNNFKELYYDMQTMNNVLIDDLSNHFGGLMLSYIKKAQDLIYKIIAINLNFPNLNQYIGIGDHEFCVISFLVNFGSNNETLCWAASFLQTVKYTDIGIYDLNTHLANISNELRLTLNKIEHRSKRSKLTLINDVDTLKSDLSSITEEIKQFSNTFCLSTVQPLVDKDLFEDLIIFNVDKFINYIFEDEKCCIYVKPGQNEDPEKIVDWDCSVVLDQTDYGIVQYKTTTSIKNIEKQDRKRKKRKDKNYRLQNVNKKLSSLSFIKNMVSQSIFDYQQIWKYYNIASDLMYFISIKEGKKILGYIKRVISEKCESKSSITIDELHMMKTKLFLYKLSFDKLVNNIFEKLHIRVTEDIRAKYFSGIQVNDILQLLDVPTNENLNDYLNDEHCKSFKTLLSNIQAAYGTPELLEFKEYYLLNPLSHVYALYNFNFSYFK